jgi:integrase
VSRPSGGEQVKANVGLVERICDQNDVRVITVHHVRHTVASLLKDLSVPARDAQIILGHSRLAVTLEIYTHADEQAQRDADPAP